VANIDDVGRPEPEPAVSEVETLRGFLNYQRATLKWKSEGLAQDQLNVSVAKSTVTIGGLLKHMTFVENEWFWRWIGDNDRLEPWLSTDFEKDPDWEFASAEHDDAETLMANWVASIQLSESILVDCLQSGGLDQLAKRKWPNGESPSLRWILVHMIEEYARHNGHADFIRESIDGSVGE
jgi:uncharacterized damage-inducible protein DinB